MSTQRFLLTVLLMVALLALNTSVSTPAHAGGVVTVCDEVHLLAALAGGGTVTFACSGTIVLTNTITIAADTTIDGSGQDVTISGNDAVRVFAVYSGVTLDLNKLIVAGGNAGIGGGILVDPDATLIASNTTFSGNTATGSGGGVFGGAVHNRGALTVSQCAFTGNSAGDGGAVYNAGGTVTISNTTFSENSARWYLGGGIYNHWGSMTVDNGVFIGNSAYYGAAMLNGDGGELAVSNSAFTGNNAYPSGGAGGAIANWNILTVDRCAFTGNSAWDGGGIRNYGETLIVSNSTFSENSAGQAGGGIYNSGWANVNNSTFSNNSADQIGGAIFNRPAAPIGALVATNTTLSGNSAGSGGGIFNAGDVVMLMNTIVANSTTGGNCAGDVSIVDGGGNLSYPDTTCPGIHADPKLGPLQTNGGPTQTMALHPGSAAIDAGDDTACPATDQRGFSRPWGSHCDIGAVEQRVVSVCDEAHLREALAGGGAVFFTCSGTITLSNTLVIAADTTIDGSGQEVTISGNNAVQVFSVPSATRFEVNSLAIIEGRASLGAAIQNDGGMLILSNSRFTGNHADCYVYCSGGAIYSAGGTVIVRSSTFSENSAFTGAGITAVDALFVDDSTFANNFANYGGGGIASGGVAFVRTSTFSGNRSLSTGGAIYAQNSVLTVSNSTFSDNHAGNVGGGIAMRDDELTVLNSTLFGNTAQEGASIFGWSAVTINLKNTIVAGSPPGGNCSGPITDGGGNVSYPDASCPGLHADPRLGPLQDNGGPTWTMALGPGSAALDAGDDAICAASPVNNRDQRGVVRPQGAHCDSGALEQLRRWLPALMVTSSP